jgi:asparagine synthase (glutamine-hydrolysing)
VEAGVSLPPEHKIHKGWTKYVLRLAMLGLLPKKVIWRANKLGFEAPTETWLRDSRKNILSEIAGSKILSKITNLDRVVKNLGQINFKQQWMLYNIAVWERVYGVHWD